MRIRVIVPTTTDDDVLLAEETYRAIALPGTEISAVRLDRGSDSIENDFDIALALPDILSRIEEAEREGIQAVIIYCMSDLGVHEARSLVSIPVIGPAEASIQYATMLAHNFSIIGMIQKDNVFVDRVLRRYNLLDRLASLPILDIPVPEIDADPSRILEACLEASLRAIREDGAAAIILGLAGLPKSLGVLQERIAEEGYAVPVIDPTVATLRMAECLLSLELAPSY